MMRRLEPALFLASLLLVVQPFRGTGFGLWGEPGLAMVIFGLVLAVVLQVLAWLCGFVFAPRRPGPRSRIRSSSAQLMAIALAVHAVRPDTRITVAKLAGLPGTVPGAIALAVAGLVVAGWALGRLPMRATRGLLAVSMAGALTVAIGEGTIAAMGRNLSASAEEVRSSGPANLYYIVLDSFGGLESMPSDIEGAADLAQRIRRDYEAAGFVVEPRVHTNFFWSPLSLYSLYDNALHFEFQETTAAHYVLPPNRLFDQIAATGLRPVVYGNAYLDHCPALAEHDPLCVEYGVVQASHPIDREVQLTLLIADVLNRLAFVPAIEQKRRYYGLVNSISVLDQLIADAERHPRGRFVYAHLLIPHEPFLYDAACEIDRDQFLGLEALGYYGRIAEPEARKRWQRYVGQLACAHSRVMELVARLEALGVYEESTLIVHGDHGTRISLEGSYGPRIFAKTVSPRMFLDFYSTFLGVKQGVFPLDDVVAAEPDEWRSLSSVVGQMMGWETVEGGDQVYRRSPMSHLDRPEMGSPSSSGGAVGVTPMSRNLKLLITLDEP